MLGRGSGSQSAHLSLIVRAERSFEINWWIEPYTKQTQTVCNDQEGGADVGQHREPQRKKAGQSKDGRNRLSSQ